MAAFLSLFSHEGERERGRGRDSGRERKREREREWKGGVVIGAIHLGASARRCPSSAAALRWTFFTQVGCVLVNFKVKFSVMVLLFDNFLLIFIAYS